LPWAPVGTETPWLIYIQRTEKRVRTEKIDLDDFVDEFNSRHDNRRITL